MKQALNNIFRKPEPPERYVVVNELISTGRYRTKDFHGRTFDVNSDKKWNVGDNVVIQSGRITGVSGNMGTPKKFVV